MKLSPQSDAVVQKLGIGASVKSGSITVGPLDTLTRTLLAVLIESFEDISRKTGEDQARAVRNHVVTKLMPKQSVTPSDQAVPSPVSHIAATGGPEPPRWRLLALRCESIRGVAPPEKEFAFEFHGESNLIYGPNGSGKSSLLSGVMWCLTGDIIADSELEDRESPMYRVAGTNSKVRSWPHVVTLPEPASFETASPSCWVELRLQRAADGKELWLKRTYPAVLESSWDGSIWSPCSDLNEFHISPLDLQLSLIAPTVFSRSSLEEASNVRSILTLILGYDNLEELGELAGKIAANRTRLEKAEQAVLRERVASLKAALNELADALPDSSAERQFLSKVATAPTPSQKDFEESQRAIETALGLAERALAEDLGLIDAMNGAVSDLADKVTVALAKLEKGVAD
jgi:energy-coupling factor transporter ATP-binding protein EcfA2